MPYRKRTRRNRRRKRNYMMVPKRYLSQKTPTGLPTITTTKLRYVETVAISTVGSGLTTFPIRANSVFDPVQNLGGSQPYSYDTWSSLYNHYVVKGSRIRVQITPIDNNQQEVIHGGVYLDDDGVFNFTNSDEVTMARKGTTSILHPNSTKPITVSSNFSARNYFNVTDINDNISRLGSVVDGNPGEGASFVAWVQAPYAGPLEGINFRLRIIVDYIVQFSEPKTLLPS